jgi:hypothetical protein
MNVVEELIQFLAARFYGHLNKGSPKNSFKSCPISEALSLNSLERPNY